MVWCQVVSVVAVLAAAATAQDGRYMAKDFPSPIRGQYDIFFANAHNWNVGSVNTITQVISGCADLKAIITVGSVFWQLKISNPNACLCCCYGWYSCGGNKCDPCWKPKPELLIFPFAVQFIDRTQLPEYVLPTRQNVPVNLPLWANSFTIVQAMDRRLVTSLMRINVTFVPRQTNLHVWKTNTGLTCGIFSCNSYTGEGIPPWWRRQTYVLFEQSANNRLGVRFKSKYGQINCGYYYSYSGAKHFYWMRKMPTPPHVFRLQAQEYYNNFFDWTWTSLTYTYNWSTAYVTSSYWFDYYAGCSDPLGVWEFYEDRRFHRNYVELDLDVVLPKLLASNDTAPTWMQDVNGSYPMQLRIQWMNISQRVLNYMRVWEAKHVLSVWVVQPFPIQDLWIEVHDESGTRIFTELERHVPYRPGNGKGLIGWWYAIPKNIHWRRWAKVTIRYNRRVRVGNRPEEEKALLLLYWARDQGCDVTKMQSPIPQTIESAPGTMGVVAKEDISEDDKMLFWPYWANLRSVDAHMFWENHLEHKFNYSDSWRNLTCTHWYVEPKEYEHAIMIKMATLMVTWGMSGRDNSSTWWVLADSFYPAKPAMLPHFWDQAKVDRLFGHTQIVQRIAYDLGNWTWEHKTMGDMWPWFRSEIELPRYQWMRAHVRRCAIVNPNDPKDWHVIPVVSLMRHSRTATPSFRFSWDDYAEELTGLANYDISMLDEISPDFNAASFTKQEYFLRFGVTPAAAKEAVSIPGWDGWILKTTASRQEVVERWAQWYGLSYKNALAKFITVLGVKYGNLPLSIDGLGSTSLQVAIAQDILTAERTVAVWQLSSANAEFAGL